MKFRIFNFEKYNNPSKNFSKHLFPFEWWNPFLCLSFSVQNMSKKIEKRGMNQRRKDFKKKKRKKTKFSNNF